MPSGLNGIELAHRARKMRPGLRVILTSGYAETLLNERGLVSDLPILVKPYRISELAETLRGTV
jgi:DNA-binding LytR/AlgR family response regulator